MFTSARIKLTAWYLLIIMTISLSFSVAMFNILTAELDRVERMQRLRIEHDLSKPLPIIIPPNGSPRIFYLDPDLVSETKNRFALTLVLINTLILGASAVTGYFLAGRTLKPIKDMIDEQNRFVTDASHELRTPLTSLKSEIEVNLRDKKLTVKNAKKLLESNLEEVNHLQSLSDKLIKLAQYQKGTGGYVKNALLLPQVINEAVKRVLPLADNKKITISNNVGDCYVKGDKSSLVELFIILLDNSIKYSPEGKRVEIVSSKVDHQIFIDVKDQGVGIDKKEIPFLFDRFYRAEKSRTKSDTNGYGLGLSIAKQIVFAHEGHISVQSAKGEGATFTVELPELVS